MPTNRRRSSKRRWQRPAATTTNGSGSARSVQLNVHFHTLVLDGVFSEARPGPLTFHSAPPPSDEEVAHVLATVRARSGSCSPAVTWSPPTTRPRRTRSPKSRPSWPASLRPPSRGASPSAPVPAPRPPLGDEPDLGHVTSRGPRQAQLDGFDLHANVWVPPNDRALASSSSAATFLRPRSPRTASASAPTGASSSNSRRRARWNSHFLFEPIEFLEKLAAIIPRPA